MTEDASATRAIAVDEAHRYASAGRQVAAASKLHGLEGLAGATLDAAPITIHDLGGEALFHDFKLAGANGPGGTIRIAATTALGAPIVSMSAGDPGWSEQTALRLATEQLHAKTPEAQVTGSRLVCYAYPKIGIELTFMVKGGAPQTELFDASSGGVVEMSDDKDHQFTRYSLLSQVKPQIKARLQAFDQIAARLRQLTLPPIAGGAVTTPPATVQAPSASAKLNLPLPAITSRSGMVRQSPYCPSSPPGNSHYAQITNYFCVDASAQMLLEHYGWNYTQNQIATAMGTSAALGGTTGAGLVNGFANLTHHQFILGFDDSAPRAQQFANAVDEITANRPLFTQVPHHYRVCMGYSEIKLGGVPIDQWLYIYDPWPWNADLCKPGPAYWESWSTSPVMWFGIVHHA
jgi:hypothetical protein